MSPLPMPSILQYVADRDMWRWSLEHSKEINAYISTLPDDFDTWAAFDLTKAREAGEAILRITSYNVCYTKLLRKQVEGAPDVANYYLLGAQYNFTANFLTYAEYKFDQATGQNDAWTLALQYNF